MLASVSLAHSPAVISASNVVGNLSGLSASEAPHQNSPTTEASPSAANHGYNAAQLSKDAVTALQEAGKSENQLGLTEEEQAIVQQLKARDREVRNHEQAHAAVGGQYAGSPTYTYQSGPDNQRYAVGGEVKIDASPVAGDPEATIQKMDTVIRAALAPAEPSAQDRKVAATASARKLDAQIELNSIRDAERRGENPETGEVIGSDTGDQPTGPSQPSGATPDPSAIINLFA
ncbi:hypothetical protein GUA87_13970 [Sneathiella sp. P13V-1]|uniref:putative metalloprotease CJM1_0395 family protein n=1 Tax=Sneathiella sp. P13V-1 TaxID=2697366 RepID=UPI00187B3957|nr:putative metalloprotease CJM1_0395 family protein [Sneathiella sp. P13V-1]MBE7637960.1 hypothetical protein [Sneathiella sp. P13V-1]